MIAGCGISEERTINEKCAIEDWPDHVAEVAHERAPSFKMGVVENRMGIIELEVTGPGAGIDCHNDPAQDHT